MCSGGSLPIAYYAVAELATNTSPGKAIMGLGVRDDLAKLPAKRQILIRSAMRTIDILPVMLVGVGEVSVRP